MEHLFAPSIVSISRVSIVSTISVGMSVISTISIMTVIPSFGISFGFTFCFAFLSLCFLFSGFDMDIRISIGIGVMVSISQTMMIDGWSNSMMSIGSDWSCMGIGYWSYMVSIRISISIG